MDFTYSKVKTRWDNTALRFFSESTVWFGLPWIISFHYEPPVGRAQAVTPQVLLKNTRLVSLLDTAGISSSSPSSSDLELGTSFQTLLNEFFPPPSFEKKTWKRRCIAPEILQCSMHVWISDLEVRWVAYPKILTSSFIPVGTQKILTLFEHVRGVRKQKNKVDP